MFRFAEVFFRLFVIKIWVVYLEQSRHPSHIRLSHVEEDDGASICRANRLTNDGIIAPVLCSKYREYRIGQAAFETCGDNRKASLPFLYGVIGEGDQHPYCRYRTSEEGSQVFVDEVGRPGGDDQESCKDSWPEIDIVPEFSQSGAPVSRRSSEHSYVFQFHPASFYYLIRRALSAILSEK